MVGVEPAGRGSVELRLAALHEGGLARNGALEAQPGPPHGAPGVAVPCGAWLAVALLGSITVAVCVCEGVPGSAAHAARGVR